MDVSLLLKCFSATLQADPSTRQDAEVQLRQLAATPGFLGGCLDILASNSVEIGLTVKKATAVYFKNRIVKFWSTGEHNEVDKDEKPVIRDRILPVLIHSDYNTKQQLIPVLRVLISYDFPARWPTLLQNTGELLQLVPSGMLKDEDFSALYTGLLCFSEICRKFRWVSNDDRSNDLDPIIVEVFPHLVEIGNALISNPENMTELTSEIVKLILKTYKFVTYFDLPLVLQTKESFVAWGELHGGIINMRAPSYVIQSHLDEQEKSFLQISKCYKWSVANLYRIFTRYASQNLSKKFSYDDFQRMFCDDFVPHLIPNILLIIGEWCSHKRWLSSPCLFQLLQFLSQCVTQKSTWGFLRPCFENLVSHLIYPLLCPSNSTLELFENDPHEYIHSNIDIYDDLNTPDAAALGLLVTLVDKRKKVTLEPIVTFVFNQLTLLQSEPETIEVAKKKEGALRLIGGISHYLVIPQYLYYDQMESFLNNLVFPGLTSKFNFLKARSLEVSLKFSDLKFKKTESLSLLFHGILDNFGFSNDENACLPVNLECALAIQAFMNVPEFREVLSTIILPTMSKLLELSNEIDNDAVSMVMQECVENFPEQLQPFGVDLMRKLVEQFMRLAAEIDEASNVDVDEFTGDYDDNSDKLMAAIGLLNTMITVLLSFENSLEICIKLEEVIAPVIEYVLVNKMDDFLTEIGELMENCTFLLRSISPIMWTNFENLFTSFTDGIALMYTEDLSQCLHNFLIYGLEDLKKSPYLTEKFYKIIKLVGESDDVQAGYNDMVIVCELAQTFILSLREQAATYIPSIVELVLSIYQASIAERQHVRNSAFDVNVNNVIITSMVYDMDNILLCLGKNSQLAPFFERWFSSIPSLSRVYDLKLSVLALISLMNNNNALNILGPEVVLQIGANMMLLLRALPKAIENLENKRKNFDESGFVSKHAYSPESWDHESFEEPTDSADPVEAKATDDYLNFLLEESIKLKSSGFFDEDEEQVVEDPLATTPLDNINIFQVFKEFVLTLHSTDNNKYSVLFGNLNKQDSDALLELLEAVP